MDVPPRTMGLAYRWALSHHGPGINEARIGDIGEYLYSCAASFVTQYLAAQEVMAEGASDPETFELLPFLLEADRIQREAQEEAERLREQAAAEKAAELASLHQQLQDAVQEQAATLMEMSPDRHPDMAAAVEEIWFDVHHYYYLTGDKKNDPVSLRSAIGKLAAKTEDPAQQAQVRILRDEIGECARVELLGEGISYVRERIAGSAAELVSRAVSSLNISTRDFARLKVFTSRIIFRIYLKDFRRGTLVVAPVNSSVMGRAARR